MNDLAVDTRVANVALTNSHHKRRGPNHKAGQAMQDGVAIIDCRPPYEPVEQPYP